MAKQTRKSWDPHRVVPSTPAADLLNYWARGPGSEPLRKPAAECTYSYVQISRSPADALRSKKERRRRYVARVTEDHAGRRRVRTERYDPERGSGPNCIRVDLPSLPRSMRISITAFTWAMWFIAGALSGPWAIFASVTYALFCMEWIPNKVQRARFARQLAKDTRDYDLPPLLSTEELDARVFTLANPDEDRTFDDPAPIPMAQGLRDRAWQRWEELLPKLVDQEYEVGRTAYAIKQNSGFADGPDHPMHKLVRDIRGEATLHAENVVIWNGYRDQASVMVGREDHPDLRPLFEALGREVLGPEQVARIEDRRRAAAHGEPMLDRSFTARTDCADGHVGEHPILSIFTDSTGTQRVRRGCLWCPSIWSETV